MAHAPTPTKHEPAKHEPSKHDPAIVEGSRREPVKVVGDPGSLVMPLTEPAVGDKPLVGATGVKGEHIEDGERDPDTIAEEQRRRSEEYEKALISGDPLRMSPNDRTNERQDALQHDPHRSPPPKK